MRHYLMVLALAAAARAATDQPQGRACLERQVRHELVMPPSCCVFDNFACQVGGGSISLSGQVTRPTRKKNAERAGPSIDGHAALNRYALMAVPSIHIAVKNGRVTIEGVAASDADSSIGVFSVTNRLGIEGMQ